jgi:cell division protein ZapE
LNIREAYADNLNKQSHGKDVAQEQIVDLLGELQQRLSGPSSQRRGLFRFFGRKSSVGDTGVPGLYLWGGVGRGKTYLMDLFFETLAIEAKRRVHFHRLMREVHERLAALGDIEDPLDRVAANIASETKLLCLDEFFVSDIGDAMILSRLLDGLFRRGVTLVTTSNTQPDDLYTDGLQRQQFLPAVDLLNTRMQVVNLDGGIDYRLRLLQQAGTYLTPDDASARTRLQNIFDNSASSQIAANQMLDINGREIRARLCAKGIVWFDFSDICDGPRSQNDYIEIARWYPTVIIAGVPAFDHSLDDQCRRFIALVDEFYDRHVKLILSAATGIDALYSGARLSFEFNRTASRLIEMQSTDYLASPHLA